MNFSKNSKKAVPDLKLMPMLLFRILQLLSLEIFTLFYVLCISNIPITDVVIFLNKSIFKNLNIYI